MESTLRNDKAGKGRLSESVVRELLASQMEASVLASNSANQHSLHEQQHASLSDQAIRLHIETDIFVKRAIWEKLSSQSNLSFFPLQNGNNGVQPSTLFPHMMSDSNRRNGSIQNTYDADAASNLSNNLPAVRQDMSNYRSSAAHAFLPQGISQNFLANYNLPTASRSSMIGPTNQEREAMLSFITRRKYNDTPLMDVLRESANRGRQKRKTDDILSHRNQSLQISNLSSASNDGMTQLDQKIHALYDRGYEPPQKVRKDSHEGIGLESNLKIGQSKFDNEMMHKKPQTMPMSFVGDIEELTKDGSLVCPDIRGHAPDVLYVALAQMMPCLLSQEDQTGKCKHRDIGAAGLCCKHCGGSPGCGRFFPSTFESFVNGTNPDRIVSHVGHICRHVPVKVREAIQQLEKLEELKPTKQRYGSRKRFFSYAWAQFCGKGGETTSSG